MSYSPGYSIDTRAGGDTVLGAFEKYNAEAVKIYGILNALKDNDLTPSELEELKTGNILGSRVIGTVAGNIDGSNITGTIPAYKVLGALTQSTIEAGKVTGLTEFVNEIIDGGGSSDKGYGITQSSLNINGYAKFGNGLIVQWGKHDVEKSTGNAQLGDVTFPTGFYSKCFCVMLSVQPQDGSVIYGATTGLNAVLYMPPSTDIFHVAIMPSNQSAVTLYYVAIGV